MWETAIAGCAAAVLALWLRSERRWQALRKDLLECSETVCRGLERQIDEHRKLAGSVSDIEERLIALAAGDTEAPRPVDRRHQVVTLSGRGLGTEEIARRLNIPRGEAELILNLKQYGAAARAAGFCGEGRKHAQA